MSQISLVNLNIEGGRHLERVRNFIEEIKPDVVCLQEVLESNFKSFEKNFGMSGLYAPLTRLPEDYKRDRGEIVGTAIFSRLPIKEKKSEYYYGNGGEVKFLNKENIAETESFNLLKMVIASNDEDYVIATTHFVWTPDGEANADQRKAIDSLLNLTKKESSLVLCGDFNAPRGREIFAKIASVYKDNIPAKYESSLDPNLHRVKRLRLMVDGLFSTPDYRIEDVKLTCGVSDHCAVTAKISKR